MADEQHQAATPDLDLEKRLQDLRTNIASDIRVELRDERVRRAEKYSDYMRNWLAILTTVVTVVLFAAGLLGIKSYSDMQAAQGQVKRDADDISKKAVQVDEAAAKVTTVLGDVEPRVQKLESNLSGMESQYAAIRSQYDQLQHDVRTNAVLTQQNRLTTTNLQTSLGSFITGPIITKTPLLFTLAAPTTLEGRNFGSHPGKLWVALQSVPSQLSATQQILVSSIQEWSDTAITFTLSGADVSALNDARSRLGSSGSTITLGGSPIQGLGLGTTPVSFFLTFKVDNSEGQTSSWSGAVYWY